MITMTRTMIIVLISLTTIAADDSCQNCKDDKCDIKNKCANGCKPGFVGDKCLHKCSSNCVDLKCEHNLHTGNYPCSIGCTPGYYGYQCNAPCNSTDDEGKCDRYSGTSPYCGGTRYGENCETSCLSNCNGSVCDNTGKCFRDVCIPGRYGAGCRKLCGSNCKLCHNNTGECILFADEGEPDSSKCSCDVQVREESVYFPVIITLLCIIAIGIVFQTADICMRRKERPNTRTASNYNSGGVCIPHQFRCSSCSSTSMELVPNSSSGEERLSGSQTDRRKERPNTRTASNCISGGVCIPHQFRCSSCCSTSIELVPNTSSGEERSSGSQTDRRRDDPKSKTASNNISRMVCDSDQSTSSSSGFETSSGQLTDREIILGSPIACPLLISLRTMADAV